jgi:hypothetical protein
MSAPPEEIDRDAAADLTPYATIARYPGFADQPTTEAFGRFEALAATCLTLLRSRIATGP